MGNVKRRNLRGLTRTSASIINGGVETPGRKPQPILAGLLPLESGWKPAFDDALKNLLLEADHDSHLDMGCSASNGFFVHDGAGIRVDEQAQAATAFLFELIARLQATDTVPAFDARTYARWLA